MADAFFYMLIVGAGLSTGISIVGFISWKLFNRLNRKNKKKGGKLNGIV